jgi:prevent-host-death family protein
MTWEKPSTVVTSTKAKARLGELVDRASRGETIHITRYGRVIARLVPPDEPVVPRTVSSSD